MQESKNFSPQHPEYTPKYPTVWGSITFEELYQRTYNIIAGKLRRDNLSQEDVEDCLQVAFLKVWRKLQKNSHLFMDKSPSYILRSIYFYTKVPRVSQQRHYRKTLPISEIPWIANTYNSIHRLETWIDIQIAIVETVDSASRMSPYAMFALYSLITHVAVGEIIEVLGCSSKTMTNYRNQVRNSLRSYLSGYDGKSEATSQTTRFAQVSVASALCENLY